jgi:plasmid maintenance system antidote protein VapI
MGKKKHELPPLSDQLRAIITEHELSRNAICVAAEVDPSQLHRFLHGTGRLTTDSLDRLGRVLGLRFEAE